MGENRKRNLLSLILLLVLGLTGCRTALIPEPTKNSVPAGMSLETIRTLIVLSIDPFSRQRDDSIRNSQKELREVYSSIQPSNKWSIEDIKPGAIRAGTSLYRRGSYVAVKIHFTKLEWWIAIVEGRNIKFDGEQIHKNALLWVEDLEHHIRRAFGTYQTMING